jgi:GTPase SAR1 family protein
MPRLPDLAKGFKTLRELDLNAIKNEAEAPFHIAVIGDPGVGKSTLITQLLSGPRSGVTFHPPPISEYNLNEEILVQPYSTVILMLDIGRSENTIRYPVLEKLRSYNVPIIVCYNKVDTMHNTQTLPSMLPWPGTQVIALSATDRQNVLENLVPEFLRNYKEREVLLARHLPMFREPVSRKLIEDTCLINAAYSLTTGLAEMNILFDLPLNLADMVVLTKNQALMGYKIALALDLPSDWHETIPKLAVVVGSGFLWRLIARQLVGLVPAFGIVPKVAVSYAGTYAVGQAVYRWCANGGKINPKQLKSIFAQALERGREEARMLAAKLYTVSPGVSKKTS